ncbi:MAG TPA: DUF1343 domain-containing protein [Bacteroidia bacterium]|nr:DUF1343 domain-containing protein [Bacteroidia bacterium]HNU32720.1 DUF1343 domain-containing protein [Bacteroidia bacterium]
MMRYAPLIFFITIVFNCYAQPVSAIETGAQQTKLFVPLLKEKQVGVVANQTSVIGKTHLIDSLLALKINVKKVFAPEHGFRGEGEAGETIKGGIDTKTGLQIVSLYGNHKKPNKEDVEGIDLMVFDIQDVGVRFYTYISTLQYVMEACAENNIELLVLDRPNPNGFFIDGPVLEKKYESFVGMQSIPVVHGLTIGEYAQMLNGEKLLANNLQCKLKVITCANYNHKMHYELPVAPSPNLPNMASIYLYPTLCFFEGTPVSVGRGTENPFQVIGYPSFTEGNFQFTPKSMLGKAAKPMYENQSCSGIDLREFGSVYIKNAKSLYLFWIISMYQSYPEKEKFFTPFFDKLAGTNLFANQIIEGKSEEEIRKSWQADINKYKLVRKRYLLYDDFE